MSGLFDVDVLPSGEVILRFEDGTRASARIPSTERAIVSRSTSRYVPSAHGEGGVLRSDRYLEELRAVQQAIEPPPVKPRPARRVARGYARTGRRTCQERLWDDTEAFGDPVRGDPLARPFAQGWRTCQNVRMTGQALCARHALQALRYLIWVRLTVSAYQR